MVGTSPAQEWIQGKSGQEHAGQLGREQRSELPQDHQAAGHLDSESSPNARSASELATTPANSRGCFYRVVANLHRLTIGLFVLLAASLVGCNRDGVTPALGLRGT